MLQPGKTKTFNGPRKVLDAPIHLASMSVPAMEDNDVKSIWLQTRDDNFVSNMGKIMNLVYSKLKKMKLSKYIW